MALSGVSITAPRQLEVDFSLPYTEHSYFAIVRCSESSRFLTFEDLDQSGITVSAQRGSAGASYALAHLQHATVRLVDDGPLELQTVVDATSDAAITTPYSVRRHRGLCIGLQRRPFFSTPVAAVFPRGSPLMEPVNEWLRRRLDDGTVPALLDHYGAR